MGIMAKVPRSGQVKTRLVPPLTHEQASVLSQCFLRDVAAAVVRAAEARRGHVQGHAVYSPEGEEESARRIFPDGFGLVLQRGQDLGERLFHAIEDLLSAGFASVCLINGDSPTLPSALLQEAARALESPGDRVVLGPASDGGYYLIGLKRAHRRLFEGIAWSTEVVRAQTEARARELSLPLLRLPEWHDVDDGRSLRALCRELFEADGEHARPEGANTRAYLEALLPQLDSLLVG
jgi:rSAM/selenodomain-associated transferase 1